MNKKLMKELINTRAVLKQKLKNIKLNEIDKENILEETFQPITKPLKNIIGKLDNFSSNKKKHTSSLKNYDESNDYDEEDNDDTDNNIHDLNSSIVSTNSSSSMDYYDVNDKYDESDFIDVKSDMDDDKKRVKVKLSEIKNENNDASSSSTLYENVNLLIKNNMIDRSYGFNIDPDGNWCYGSNKLKFNTDNSINIGDAKIKLTPGLFELLFHSKPHHFTNNDLRLYKDILVNNNAHKRHFQTNSQIKGSRSYKYKHIIKKLFTSTATKSKNQVKGNGLLLKSLDKRKSKYIYWDDPNELVNRLRLLVSSTSAGHNNHKNEIISIVEELREANIIY